MDDELAEVLEIFAIVGVGLAVFSVVFSVFLYWWIFRRRAKIKDPAPGVLEVTGAPIAVSNSRYQTAQIAGVLHADEIPSRAVLVKDLVKVSLLPSPGDKVPVMYCRRDPDQVRIQWKQVSPTKDRALLLAEKRAELANLEARLGKKVSLGDRATRGDEAMAILEARYGEEARKLADPKDSE